MLANSSSQSHCPDRHRKSKANFVHDGFSKQSTGGGKQPEEDGGSSAMDEAEPGKADCNSVEAARR